MSWAIVMTCINVAEFVLISYLEKDHSMMETRRLKNVAIFIQTILSFMLSRKIFVFQLGLSTRLLLSMPVASN